MSARVPPSNRSARPMVVAVVLGTALSAVGTAQLNATETAHPPVQDIGRYCATCWRNARLPADAWGDCTQEVFRRLLERVPTTRWRLALEAEGEERKEFLRAIDTVKKRVQRTRRFSDAVDLAADTRSVAETRRTEDRELVRQAAEEVLSPRQQRIVQLSLEGWSAGEIGERLALPVERVSDEKYKAIRKLRAHLADHPG